MIKKIEYLFYKRKLSNIKAVAFDFDGVFTDNAVYIDEDGREFVRCSRADGIGLKKLKDIGIITIILSSEPNPIVLKRANKLKIECINNLDDKGNAFKSWLHSIGISAANAVFVGNDINDMECLDSAGCAVVPADAVNEVKEKADIILKNKGGQGAVRELCELIIRIKRTV